MRPLRVARVIGRLNVGGPAMHVVNLARGLDALEWEETGTPAFRTRLVAGVISPEEGDMAYYADARGVPVTTVPEMGREVSPLDDARALARLVRLFRRDRPDIVHTHTAKAGALGRTAAIMAGVPVRVHTFHGHVLGGDYFGPTVTAAFREVERQLARFTHRILVLTEGQKRELVEDHRIAPPERFEVVPLGLDLEPFLAVDRATDGPEARRALGLGPHEPVVGIVGRLVPIKNHELALEALAEPAGAQLRLLVVGGGEREAELRRFARSIGVADRVTWLGWRDDLSGLYAAMDALVLTSHDEGTPVAIIEALAAGVPVVARAVGGVPEVLEGGRLGRLVAEPDPKAVAEALQEALGVDDGGEPIRARIAERFSVERLARDVAGLYRREVRCQVGAGGLPATSVHPQPPPSP